MDGYLGQKTTKMVSFYGKSSSTDQNGQHIHPKGIKPTYRPNYLELTIKLLKCWKVSID